MAKCKCYHEDKGAGFGMVGARCYGTKECEPCWCGGDESQCDFYPEIRERATKKLNTAEMWLAAQKDGKTYVSKNADALYSKEFGLVEKCNVSSKIYLSDFPDFEHLMKSTWEEIKTKTRAEVEAELGIKIID